MKFLLLLLPFIVACQDYNSNSADRNRYGPLVLPETDPNFRRSYLILQSKCMNCHQHAAWADYKTNDRWESEGYVLPGNPDDSLVLRRIINSGHAGESNMPPGGPAMDTDDYDHLVDWVTNIP